jgi:hypothetical protein
MKLLLSAISYNEFVNNKYFGQIIIISENWSKIFYQKYKSLSETFIFIERFLVSEVSYKEFVTNK